MATLTATVKYENIHTAAMMAGRESHRLLSNDDWYYSDESLVRLSQNIAELSNVCTVCTLRIGRWIDTRGYFGSFNDVWDTGNRTTEEEWSDDAPVCPVGYQCVDTTSNEEYASGTASSLSRSTGCCSPCSASQYCGMATIAFGRSKDEADLWNKCPDGHLCKNGVMSSSGEAVKKCAAGYMCQNNLKMSCAEARAVPVNAGYGDIHAGSFCPEGSTGLKFCPQGSYCPSPDMTVELVCPEGNFCPMKTEFPTIACAGCPPGATDVVVFPFPSYLFVLSLAALLFVLYIPVRICSTRSKRQRQTQAVARLKTHKSKMSDRVTTTKVVNDSKCEFENTKRSELKENDCGSVPGGVRRGFSNCNPESLAELLELCVDCGGERDLKYYHELENILQLSGSKVRKPILKYMSTIF